eukprot:538900_1
MGANFACLIPRLCTPLNKHAVDEDDRKGMSLENYFKQKVCKKSKQITHEISKPLIHIPSIVIPPSFNITPAVSQILASASPQLVISNPMNSILSIINADHQRIHITSDDLNVTMHVRSDATRTSPTQPIPIVASDNDGDMDFTESSVSDDSSISLSDDEDGVVLVSSDQSEFSDWSEERQYDSDQTDDSFVNINT